MNFKSMNAYKKWLAYNWMHNKKVMGVAPHQTIKIKGKKHKVKHSKKTVRVKSHKRKRR